MKVRFLLHLFAQSLMRLRFFFCPPPAAQALALFRLRSIRARFALFRCAPYGLYAGYVLGLAPLRAYAVGYGHSALFRLRSIRALRRLCARACALARIRRRLRYCPPRGAIRSACYSSISCLCLPKQGYLRARCSPPPRFRLDLLHIDHIIVKIILIFSIA